MSNALGVLVLLLYMLFDGNWINLKNVPVYYRWLAKISFMGDAVEAAIATEFRQLDFSCTGELDADTGLYGDEVPAEGVPTPHVSRWAGPQASSRERERHSTRLGSGSRKRISHLRRQCTKSGHSAWWWWSNALA